MIRRRWIQVGVAPLMLSVMATALASEYGLDWNTVDSGGGTSTGATFELAGSIGQTDAGTMSGGTFDLAGGFWPGAAVSPVLPGNCDAIAVIELTDYDCFHACFTGPETGLGTSCTAFDFDGDNDVDLNDFVEMQTRFGEAP